MERIRQALRSWGLLLLALVLAAGAFFLARHYLESKEQAIREQMRQQGEHSRQAVVATTDLGPGDVVDASTMAVADVPAEHLSQFAVSPSDFNRFQGAVLAQPMSRGEPLLAHFVEGRATERFSDLLEVGERAVTLEVDEINSNAGMLRAGDYVDVFVRMNAEELGKGEGGDGDAILYPVQQRVRVLAAGPKRLLAREQSFVRRRSEDDYRGYATVTVGVKRADAARLQLATELGDVLFMLRNAEDSQRRNIGPLDKHLLLTELAEDDRQFVEFFTPANNENGIMKPAIAPVESITPGNNRKLTKSVPIITAQGEQ